MTGDIEMVPTGGVSTDAATDFAARDGVEIQALPPVDRGKDAYLFLLAATAVETLVWGLPFSIGILHAYWSTHMFEGQETTLTLASTLQTGLTYMAPALVGPLFTAYPMYRRKIQIFGLVVSSASLIGAAFATKAWHLVVTVGCFYPFAGALYLPCATLLFEWFTARRGFASGVMFAGTGVGGTVFPFLVSALLGRFGYRATMCALGVGFLALNLSAVFFIKPRLPIRQPQAGAPRARPIDWSFAARPVLWFGVLVILFTSLGNFVPSLWIPSWAADINVTKPDGTALLSLMNAASVPGNAITGFLSDRMPLRYAIVASCGLGALACAVLWGFGTNDALLVTFSLVWGVTGLSFVTLWTKMISTICRDDPVLPSLVFSLFACLKGVGNMTSGPITTSLLKIDAFPGALGAYGSNNYGVLLVFTSVMMFLGGVFGVFFNDPKA